MLGRSQGIAHQGGRPIQSNLVTAGGCEGTRARKWSNVREESWVQFDPVLSVDQWHCVETTRPTIFHRTTVYPMTTWDYTISLYTMGVPLNTK